MRYLLVLFILASYTIHGQSTSKWIQLFNGKDLDGWIVKISKHQLHDNSDNTFIVEDGTLKVIYHPDSAFNEQFGHIFYKKPFSRYLLGVEYRFTGKQAKGGPSWAYRNSGIMVHCQSPESMLRNQDFPYLHRGSAIGRSDEM